MNRTEWNFTYTASTLSEAAEKKRLHHAERLNWWTEQKTVVTKKVTETGIEVHDSVGGMNYQNTKAGYGPEIRIDAGLQRDLSECQQKINHHLAKRQEYAGWVQVLEANANDRLSLHHDDYLFFFGE